jgi:DNA repair protein RecN (Recombination protein N)
MLVELRIRNVAVIEAVTLPLGRGLNVLTGETGAGKSLIIGALGLLVGERAAADRIRTGAEKAVVEGVFDVAAVPGVRALLDERGIDGDDELLVLKREVGSNGRSRGWINGTTVTATVLAEIGSRLVNVLGQHDARQLLEPELQREMLDAYVGAGDLRTRVAAAHGHLAALRAREAELERRRQEAARRADYLRFVVREIEDVKPVAGEDEALESEIRRLTHAEELQSLAAQAASAISGDGTAVLSRLVSVRRALSALMRIDPETERLQVGVDTASYALEELARELEGYAEGIEVDPARLRQLERRRDHLLQLQRKYGPTIAQVQAALDEARSELALVDDATLDQEALASARAVAEGELVEAAAALTRARQGGARQFAKAVSLLLPALGMAEGRLEVRLEALTTITAEGAESVGFLAVLNAGGEPRPLARLASGGELSRVMLALSTVLARLQQVPTLVFDEVDAGIGGAVAWQVGAMMHDVARHHQVLAISHLAQIAARADHHIVVQKGAVGTVTTADTRVITADDRVVEIARMLGGDADREVSRAHARELLARGDELPAVAGGLTGDADTAAGRRPTTQRRGKPV